MASIKDNVYRLWRRISGGNIPDDTPYTYRELRGYVVSEIKDALRTNYLEQRNVEDFKYGDDSISYSYIANVLTDNTTGLKYVELKGSPISIAGNRFIDINSINPVAIPAINYIPVRKEEMFLLKLQNDIPCMTYFYKDNGNAYFFGSKVNESSVLVSERYSIGDDDEIDLNIPEEIENKAFERAYRLLVPLAPADRINDGVNNN